MLQCHRALASLLAGDKGEWLGEFAKTLGKLFSGKGRDSSRFTWSQDSKRKRDNKTLVAARLTYCCGHVER